MLISAAVILPPSLFLYGGDCSFWTVQYIFDYYICCAVLLFIALLPTIHGFIDAPRNRDAPRATGMAYSPTSTGHGAG